MKIVSTDMCLIVNDVTHDLKIIYLMLNRVGQRQGFVYVGTLDCGVCNCLVYQRVILSPTLPIFCFAVYACARIRGTRGVCGSYSGIPP